MAERHGDFARPSRVNILLPLNPTVLAWRDVEPDGVLVMNHDTVGPPVDPALVRVAGDVDAPSSDIASPIMLMPLWGRELKQVDILFFVDILKKGTILYDFWRDRLDLLVSFSPGADEVHFGLACRKVEGQRKPFPGTQRI